MGLFSMSPDQPPFNYQTGIPQGQPEQPKPKFFGEGGMGRNIAGSIGDALLQYGKMDSIFAPAMRERQKVAQAQQQQAAEYAQFVQKEQYKAANPEESPMIRDTNAYIGMDDSHQAAYRSMHPGQIVNMTLPDGQFYSGPAEGIAAALGGGQAPPSPQLPRAHELTPIGGAGGNVSGNFRR